MKKIILLLTLTISILACTKDKPDQTNENAIFIRIENASVFNYENIIVSSGGQTNDYGSLSSNEKSVYKIIDVAYRYAYIKLEINNETFKIQPYDYVGETPLVNGHYTYVVDANSTGGEYDRLSLEFVED